MNHATKWADQRRGFETSAGTLITDLEQGPGRRGAPTGVLGDWPVLYTHGHLASLSRARPKIRIATAFEHFAAMGYHMVPSTCLDFNESSVVELLRPLSPGQLKKLCGNSMHQAVQASWMFYTICNCAPREYPVPQRSITVIGDDDDWEAHD